MLEESRADQNDNDAGAFRPSSKLNCDYDPLPCSATVRADPSSLTNAPRICVSSMDESRGDAVEMGFPAQLYGKPVGRQ